MLTQAADELPDAPLYYNLHDLCKTLKCTPPKTELFRSAIINAGYR
jgi:tRNA (guanine26-N2/guanine27-N2)-dimethyltransferase